MSQLKCVVVTPEATILEQEADFVVVPLFDGEKGIAPGHSPVIGRLGFGELRVTQGNDLHRYYIDGGFVEIVNNVVTILTNHTNVAAELDASVTRERLSEANKMHANEPNQFLLRDRKIAQLRAQLRIAEKLPKK